MASGFNKGTAMNSQFPFQSCWGEAGERSTDPGGTLLIPTGPAPQTPLYDTPVNREREENDTAAPCQSTVRF